MREIVRVTSAVAVLLAGTAGAVHAQGFTSGCPADRSVPLSGADHGLIASAVATWEAVETLDGIVPDIEEDRTQSPPKWWRYPSALRSSVLLAAEAKRKDGLFSEVAPSDIAAGDVLVRIRGAGPCGTMAIVAGHPGQFVAVEGLKARSGKSEQPPEDMSDVFLQNGVLRPEVKAFRINVHKDSTAGHARELRRDLGHLERTVGERPLLLARGGQEAVNEKVHQLVDEAWSLGIDPAFQAERASLTGRAMVLAAALDWPGAAASAASLLDEALRRRPEDHEAGVARAALHLLLDQPAAARSLLDRVPAGAALATRARYLLARALIAQGERESGMKILRQLQGEDPNDRRVADALAASAAARASAPDPASSLRLGAEGEHAVFRGDWATVRWPITWRVTTATALPGEGFVINLLTARENLESGQSRRASVVLMAQKPASVAEKALLIKNGAREMFPKAQRKKLPPILSGSVRESFRERHDGEARAGEVNAVERDGRVFYFVLNAPADAYERFRPTFESLLKSLAPASAAK